MSRRWIFLEEENRKFHIEKLKKGNRFRVLLSSHDQCDEFGDVPKDWKPQDQWLSEDGCSHFIATSDAYLIKNLLGGGLWLVDYMKVDNVTIS